MMKPAGCAHAADHGKRLVIKIGSSTLTTSESKIDYAYLAEVTDQVARVRAAGWRPIVVTSAAIACGLERLSIEKRPHDMPSLQAAASVGQSALSTAYAEAFARHGIVTSTVLLTRRDTADRRRVVVRLTEQGRHEVQTSLDEAVACLSEVYRRMGEADTRELLRLSDRAGEIAQQIYEEQKEGAPCGC